MPGIPNLSGIDFKSIYITEDYSAIQPRRYHEAIKRFEECFGDITETDNIQIYSAPGRTEIGGNHTDHQRGQVFAASINKDAIAIVRQTNSNLISIVSGEYPINSVDINSLEAREDEQGKTIALIRGVISALKSSGFIIGGFDAYITSDVLIGAGLSSSAAFEVLIGTIISGVYNEGKIDAITIALASQVAENKFFGKPCGLMDQMASSVGNLVYIDFRDEAAPEVRKINFDFASSGYSLCITNTKGSHSNLTHEYKAVPDEMRSISLALGHNYLREASFDEVMKNINNLREKCGDRAVLRALHFLTETERAKAEACALSDGNLTQFMHLVKASGNSSFKYLQNIYVNGNIQNQNVAIALCVSEQLLDEDEASRVHGGGFAGTIQAFVKTTNVAKYKEAMDRIYGPGSCDILAIRPSGGIRII